MSRHKRKRKCRNCCELFMPDHRNDNRQKYCSKPDCRKASKSESQHHWLAKEENRDYFKDPHHVRRVQQWRKNHPGYWRRKARTSTKDESTEDQHKLTQKQCTTTTHTPKEHALQDSLSRIPDENHEDNAILVAHNDAYADDFVIMAIGLFSYGLSNT